MFFQFLLCFFHLTLMVSVDAVGQQGQKCPLRNSLPILAPVKPPVVVVKLLVYSLSPFLQFSKLLVLFRIGGLKDFTSQLAALPRVEIPPATASTRATMVVMVICSIGPTS